MARKTRAELGELTIEELEEHLRTETVRLNVATERLRELQPYIAEAKLIMSDGELPRARDFIETELAIRRKTNGVPDALSAANKYDEACNELIRSGLESR